MDLKRMEIHNAVPLFNAAQGGWELPRYPRGLREQLNPSARTISGKTSGVEVRFVVDGPDTCVTVRALGGAASFAVRRGSFFVSRHHIPAGSTQRILLRKSEGFAEVDPSILGKGGWSTDVWRLVFEGEDLLLQDVDPLGWPIRPPHACEKPTLSWLAYGSSITNGDHLAYPLIAAQLLNADVMNKGLSGSCHIEPEIADWFGTLDFDVATLELGINMRGHYDPETFRQRLHYMVQRLRETHPLAHLVLITHFLNRDHHRILGHGSHDRHQRAYDEALRDLHKSTDDERLHLIEGTDLLTDFQLLAADMIHPTHEGHAQMAQNLAHRLRPLVAQQASA